MVSQLQKDESVHIKYKGVFRSEVLYLLNCSYCEIKGIVVEYKLMVFDKSAVTFKLQKLMIFGKF